MKGLLKNNFYAALSNMNVFAVIILLVGILTIALGKKIPSLLISYILLATIGFPLSSIASIRKECATKWNKYKITTPVKRSDIVKSYFLSLLLWLGVGILLAGIGTALAVLLHGFFLDRSTDVFLLFTVGGGGSLFIAAIFFPLFYAGGEERNEVFLGLSVLAGIGLTAGITMLINSLFPRPMTDIQIFTGGMIILTCALAAFFVSYFIARYIFSRKEY